MIDEIDDLRRRLQEHAARESSREMQLCQEAFAEGEHDDSHAFAIDAEGTMLRVRLDVAVLSALERIEAKVDGLSATLELLAGSVNAQAEREALREHDRRNREMARLAEEELAKLEAEVEESLASVDARNVVQASRDLEGARCADCSAEVHRGCVPLGWKEGPDGLVRCPVCRAKVPDEIEAAAGAVVESMDRADPYLDADGRLGRRGLEAWCNANGVAWTSHDSHGYWLEVWIGSRQGEPDFYLDPTADTVLKRGAAEHTFLTVMRPGDPGDLKTVWIKEGWQRELGQALGLEAGSAFAAADEASRAEARRRSGGGS